MAMEGTSGRGQQGCGVFIREDEATLQGCGVGVPAALTTLLWGEQLGPQAAGKQSVQACPPHRCGARVDGFRPPMPSTATGLLSAHPGPRPNPRS